MRTLHKLKPKQVEHAKPGFHSDGGSLYLAVDAAGRKRWIFRYVRAGKQHDMGLGDGDYLPIADARKLAAEARRLLELGQDPLAAKRAARAKTQTFGEAADAYITAMEPDWKNEKHVWQWRQTLSDDYCRAIRSKNIATITTESVLEVLKPIWAEKPETAQRLRGRIEKVLSSAKAAGFIQSPWENPARWVGHLDQLLSKRKRLTRGHHRSLAYGDVPGLIKALQGMHAVSALALEFAILCAARTGEVIGATPAEFDLVGNTWSIAASRMKSKRAHRVPLSDRAVEIVKDAMLLGGKYVFPGSRKDAPMSNMTMAVMVNRMGLDATPHGFRTSFRTWASECTAFPYEVAEGALAHLTGDQTERAYNRTDLFKRRREMMEAWASYCASPAGDNVVPLRATKKA